MGILVSILTFMAVFLGIFTVNLVFVDLFKKDQRDRLQKLELELREQMRNRVRAEAKTDYAQLDELSRNTSSPRTPMELWKSLTTVVEQSGARISFQQLALVSVLCAAASFGLIMVFTQSWVGAGVVAAFAAIIPYFVVYRIFCNRRDKLTSQLPDALDLISRILRAGQTINQGMLVVSEEFTSPIRDEFGYCYEQQNLGVPSDVALRQLAERTGIIEIQIFVMGVLIQKNTGGNLAQLLDQLANIIRQRHRMKENIKGLTAEGRLQATILLALPFVTWFGLYVVNNAYALKLLDHPLLIMITILCMAFGAIWIRKIVVFDF